MSKKDYEAIAKVLHGFQDTNRTVRAMLTRDVAERMADLFAADNPRFDRARFLHACETGEMRIPKAKAAKALPLCVQAMKCLCAGHARGAKASAACDTRETV